MLTNQSISKNNQLDICFEDEYLLVVNKPTGVLSQPGKSIDGSIATQVREAYPDATGPMLVHRLDMDTSGLMVLAKNRHAHRDLQQQFEHRSIAKRYVAVVNKALCSLGGCITLPVRLDIYNRPRQIVCWQHGKSAETLWFTASAENKRQSKRRVLDGGDAHGVGESTDNTDSSNGHTRIVFKPVSGRTHQLRVHAAHPLGLNAAIVGDRLYGQVDKRLMLHAEQLSFTHPVSKKRICVDAPAPF